MNIQNLFSSSLDTFFFITFYASLLLSIIDFSALSDNKSYCISNDFFFPTDKLSCPF